jgi:hypothetical protein
MSRPEGADGKCRRGVTHVTLILFGCVEVGRVRCFGRSLTILIQLSGRAVQCGQLVVRL